MCKDGQDDDQQTHKVIPESAGQIHAATAKFLEDGLGGQSNSQQALEIDVGSACSEEAKK